MDQLLPTAATDLDDDALARLYDFPPALDRPWVKVNFISSADGAVSVNGRSGGLSDANDKRIFRFGRTLADVILVGAGTALIERYRGVKPHEIDADRRAALGLAPVPPIAVVSRRCTVLPDSPLVTDAIAPTIVFTTENAPVERKTAVADAGADVVATGDDDVDLAGVLADLDRRGLRRVACEGGPSLFGSLIEAGLVDELDLSVAPLLAAGDATRIAHGSLPAGPLPMRLASVLHGNGMLMLRYLRG